MRSSIALLVIAICIGAYFMYMKPLGADIKALNAKKNEYENVLNRVKEINQKRDSISQDFDSISPEELEKLNKIIPAKIDSTVLANDISALGVKYNLSLKDFKVSESNNADSQVVETSNSETYKTTVANMKLTGDYNEFLGFIEELESGVNLVDVVGLSIRPGSGTPGQSAIMDFTLEIRTYSLR